MHLYFSIVISCNKHQTFTKAFHTTCCSMLNATSCFAVRFVVQDRPHVPYNAKDIYRLENFQKACFQLVTYIVQSCRGRSSYFYARSPCRSIQSPAEIHPTASFLHSVFFWRPVTVLWLCHFLYRFAVQMLAIASYHFLAYLSSICEMFPTREIWCLICAMIIFLTAYLHFC